MAQYKINDTTLTNIADAIRNKTGELTKIAQVPMDAPTVYNVVVPAGSRLEDIITDRPIVHNVSWIDINFTFDYANALSYLSDNITVFNGSTAMGSAVQLGSGKNQNKSFVISASNPTTNIYFKSSAPSKEYGVKIEISYYDANDNLITVQEAEVVNTMTPEQMVDEINSIQTGGVPEAALNITGNCSYRFAYNGWDWFIKNFGNQITTNNITSANNMFIGSDKLTNIPFDINLEKGTTLSSSTVSYIFQNCSALKTLPLINGDLAVPSSAYSGNLDFAYMFQGCSHLREIPEDYFWNIAGEAYWNKAQEFTSGSRCNLFSYCQSLRKHPDISMLKNKVGYYNCLYSNLFNYCYALDEVVDLPVLELELTSNAFGATFSNCHHLKDITFETNEDGTAKTAKWKSQTIDLGSSAKIGYTSNQGNMTQFNSGLTDATRIDTADEWEELKDNPDAWTSNASYSRYNHESAVRTINSLPDTSAYLATAGGTNTIKFYSVQGSGTKNADGTNGAISKLTEEEIAVAAAKGWTVTFG